jgi:hypothetical protein
MWQYRRENPQQYIPEKRFQVHTPDTQVVTEGLTDNSVLHPVCVLRFLKIFFNKF